MSTIKISQLPEKVTMAGTEEVLINDSGTSKKFSTQRFLDVKSATETARDAALAAQTAAETAETNAETAETNASGSATTATTQATNSSTSATNAATSETNAATSASSASGSATAAAASAASAAATYDTFDDRYLGNKASNPTTDNDGDALVQGMLYFNTTDSMMMVYDGSSWITTSSATLSTLDVYKFTATSGQTAFTGTDDDGNTLAIKPTAEMVVMNGIVLESGADYTVTTTTLTLLTGATVSDEVNVYAFGNFELADHYSKTTSDNRYLALAGGTMTGDTLHGDNVKAKFGAGDDLQIYHDGANSYVSDTGTGNLILLSEGSNIQLASSPYEVMLAAHKDGAVALYYNNSLKLATTSTGVDVTGNVNLASDNPQVELHDTGSGGTIWRIANGPDGNGKLTFNDNDTERVTFTNDGNVGIGTSSPSSELTIGADTPQIDFLKSSSADVLANIRAETDAGSGGKLVFQTKRNGNTAIDRVVIDDDGNVGIGATTLEDKLNLEQPYVASGEMAISFNQSDFANRASKIIHKMDATGNGGSLILATNANGGDATERMRITSAGNVGIGTTAPSQKLHVVGKLKLTDDLQIGGTSPRIDYDGGSTGSLRFWSTSASAERMRINSSGNVGIGTTSPSATLHVHKGTAGSSSQPSGNWAAKILNQTDSSDEGGLVVANRWASTSSTPFLVGGMYDAGDGFDTWFKVNGAGDVGIGTASPSEKLYVSGNIYATGNVTAYSDERIKKNINEIPNALDAVDAIRGVSYTRTDTEEDSIGVIAQEVEALFPELIAENNEGMKSVNYNGLIGVLFSAVKELSAKVKELEAK